MPWVEDGSVTVTIKVAEAPAEVQPTPARPTALSMLAPLAGLAVLGAAVLYAAKKMKEKGT